LRCFFYHFYHSFAWTYDAVAALVSIGRWRDWGRASLPYLLGPRLLEIGFGPGHMLVELKRHSFQVYGLDESRQMNSMARARLQRNSYSPDLARGRSQSLPFPTSTFDSVLACFPSEYLFNPQTLAEIRRILKPAGRLVVIPMAWIGGNTIFDRAAKWLFQATGQAEAPSERLKDRLRPVFEQAGFNKIVIFSEQVRNSTVIIIQAENPIDRTTRH